MAEPVQIQGSSYVGKVRNPLGVIGLSIITLGIYAIVWYYKVNKEMAEIGRSRQTDLCGDSPALSVVAVTLGAFILIPAIISPYMTWVRLRQTERVTGAPDGLGPNVGYLMLSIPVINLVAAYLFQSSLNTVLQTQAGASPALTPAVAMPQPAPEVPAQPAEPQPPAPEQPAGPQSPSGPQSPA